MIKFYNIFRILSIAAFLIAIPHGISFAQEDPVIGKLPTLTYDERLVSKIELLAKSKPDSAKEQAQSLINTIDRETFPRSMLVERKKNQIRQYRDLQKNALKSAEINKERAANSLKESKNPIFDEDYQASLRKDAADWDRAAEQDMLRAEGYSKRATDIERDIQKFLDEIDLANELVARLRAVLNEEQTPEPEKTQTSGNDSNNGKVSGDDTASQGDRPHFDVYDVIGMWAYTEGKSEGLFAIVPQHVGDEPSAGDSYLEAHTNNGRVWKGAMYARIEDDDPLMEFTYKPHADEINEDIPRWARDEIAGDLEWRMEIDEAGDEVNPRLRVKFFPGEVRWPEDKNDETPVKVIGEGLPRVFELEPVTNVSIEAMAREKLQVSLGGTHNPDLKPVQSLLKGQPFTVKVTLPAEMAKEQGATLKVNIKGLNSDGDEDFLLLRGMPSDSLRPVVYSNPDAVYINECQPNGDAPRNAKWYSLYNIFGSEGDCINIETDNRDLVEFKFGEASQQVMIYGSWVQRGMDRHERAFNLEKVRLENSGTAQEIILKEETPQEKQQRLTSNINTERATQEKLQMITNYYALRDSGKLTDRHIFAIGETYLGELDGSGILYMTPRDIKFFHDQKVRREMGRGTNDRIDPNYYNKQMQAFLEGISSKDLSLKAHKGLESLKDLKWTSESEQYFITKTIQTTSSTIASGLIKAYADKFSTGLYDGFVSSTGASGMYMVLYGRDHLTNKKVPSWMRMNVALGMASGTVLSVAGSRAAMAYLPKKNVVRKTMGRSHTSGTTLIAKQSKGEAIEIAQAAAKYDDAGIGHAPKSLSPAQKQSTVVKFGAVDESKITPMDVDDGMGFTVRIDKNTDMDKMRTLAKRLNNMSTDELIEYYNRVEGPNAYIKRGYGKGSYVVDPFSDMEMPYQVGPSCNLMSTNYGVFKGTGKRYTQLEAHRIVENIVFDDVLFKGRPLKDFMKLKHENVAYTQRMARKFLQKTGARVAEFEPTTPGGLWPIAKIRHIKEMMDAGWNMKVVLKFDDPGGLHAVIIDELVYDSAGKVKAVKIYDSNISRIISVPAKRFQHLMADANKTGYSTMTAFRYD